LLFSTFFELSLKLLVFHVISISIFLALLHSLILFSAGSSDKSILGKIIWLRRTMVNHAASI
jgi:hypothetical protein